jgi:CDP-diglyceride synthetase
LLSFILTLVTFYRAAYSGKSSKNLKFYALFTLIITHIQFLLGLSLYFISPKVIFATSSMKVAVSRFYLVEHISLMLIAILLITIGYSKWKKINNVKSASKKLFTYYLIGLILILISIPWPFRDLGGAWF